MAEPISVGGKSIKPGATSGTGSSSTGVKSPTTLGRELLAKIYKGGMADPSSRPSNTIGSGTPGDLIFGNAPSTNPAYGEWYRNSRVYGEDAIRRWQTTLIGLGLLDPRDIQTYGAPDSATISATNEFQERRAALGTTKGNPNMDIYDAISMIRTNLVPGALDYGGAERQARLGAVGGGGNIQRIPTVDLEDEIIKSLQEQIGRAPEDQVQKWIKTVRSAEDSYLKRVDAFEKQDYDRRLASAKAQEAGKTTDSYVPTKFLEPAPSPQSLIRDKLEFSPDAELFKAGLFGMFVMDIMRGGSPSTIG